jgi:tetratricopeptide (TPR) repeat protein
MNQRKESMELQFGISNIGLALIVAAIFTNYCPALAAANNWQQLVSQGDADLNRQSVSDAEKHFRLALTAVEQNKPTGAIALYRKSLTLLEKKYGTRNPQEVATIVALGSVYESLGDHDLAANMYHQALSIHAKKFSHYDPAVAESLPNLDRIIQADRPASSSTQAGTGMNSMSLDASHSMVSSVVKKPAKDLLQSNDSTDGDLLSDFHKQILRSEDASTYSNQLRSASVQETALKQSRKM